MGEQPDRRKTRIHPGVRTYGSPRVPAELLERGFDISVDKVALIMAENGLVARPRRQVRRTTGFNQNMPIAANDLDRNFSVDEPDRVWVGDDLGSSLGPVEPSDPLAVVEHAKFHGRDESPGVLLRPQGPWERGSNEDTNRLLRQDRRKGTSVGDLSHQKLNTIAPKLNERPRKTLSLEAPAERLAVMLTD